MDQAALVPSRRTVMIVKILGTGCNKCVTLTENAQQALANLGIDAQIVKITDIGEIAAHGVMSTPALAIDDRVVSTGKVLTTGQIEAMLKP
jgi:small redox-active disulfide protein 2